MLAGAVVDIDDPFNWLAFQIAVVLFAEKVLPTREIPVPEVYELLLSVAGVHDVPFHFKISLLAGAIVETDDPFNWFAFQIAEVLFAEKVFPTRDIPVPEA